MPSDFAPIRSILGRERQEGRYLFCGSVGSRWIGLNLRSTPRGVAFQPRDLCARDGGYGEEPNAMSKKPLMGLAAMLVALAVMSAVAQATPHYYKSGVLIPEGEKVPILEWGTLLLSPEPPWAAPTAKT